MGMGNALTGVLQRGLQKRMRVEIYVVSIYRRSDRAGREAAGMVERPGRDERAAFASSLELWAFLCGKAPPAKARNPKAGPPVRRRA